MPDAIFRPESSEHNFPIIPSSPDSQPFSIQTHGSVWNLTNKPLPTSLLTVLDLGLKFIPSRRDPDPELLLNLVKN